MKKTNTMKKTVKPEFTVDVTNCETGFDLLVAFAKAKHQAGLAITDDELNALIDDNSVMIFVEKQPISICNCTKKPNIFKRFWNWLKYAFNW